MSSPRQFGADVWVRFHWSPSGFAALYYPWLRVKDENGNTIEIPPSGHVAGVYARSDAERGAAPAERLHLDAQNVAIERARRVHVADGQR